MKSNLWLGLILTLAIACSGAKTLAQTTNNEAPAIAPDATAPKPKPAKPAKTNGSKTAAKKPAAKTTPKATDSSRFDSKPLTPGPAVVKEKNVNVRGQAAINSEVVAHLKRGDHVVVLEEVTKKAKTDEPTRWAKIALPSNSAVWVHSSFLENGTVKSKKLNLRTGPGENFSVIGHVEKGATLKEVERKGDWVHVETPTDAYAFVAAHLLANEAAPVAVAAAETPKPPLVAATTTPPPAPAPAPVPVTITPETTTTVTTTTPPPAPAPAPAPTPVVETTVPAAKPPVVGSEPAGTTPAPAPAPAPEVRPIPTPEFPSPVIAPKIEAEDEDVKRVVTREGVVKRSVSIQAPTYFVLENLSNGKTINYLYSPSTNLVLKDLKGKRIIVTGEEMLDERWPNTPVIAIDKLETLP